MSDVLDYQAQHYLRQWIHDLPYEQRQQLRNISLCNQHVNIAEGGQVYLLTDNDGHAKYLGLMTCKNPFCCPVCSARMMEKYRSEIAAALELLRPKYFAFLVTLTIPHYKFMSWRETTDILYDTWKYFRMKSFKREHGHVFHQFNQEVPTDNWVRVCEYTWSKKNGAHPHFHCIWWCERGKEKSVLDWESRLNDFWIKQAKRVTVKYWRKHKLHEDLLAERQITYEQLADTVFLASFNAEKDGRRWNEALTFSRDKETGKLLEAKSSKYICGWGADREVTGNVRKEATAKGHYTPYQILQAAITDVSMRQVYLDFCLAVTRKPVHHRVNFSKNGLKKLVTEYQKQQDKLESSRLQKKSSWEVVCWFSEEQWYSVLDLEDATKSPIIANMLYLASQDKEVLLEYITGMCIDCEFPECFKRKCRCRAA